MYISGKLKLSGHNVKVLNYNLHDYEFVSEVMDQDVVMFTGFEEFYDRICEDAGMCRRMHIPTVVGGALATFRPELMNTICDTVVIGEGDAVVGVALRKTGIVFGYTDVPSIGLPDYEGFGIDEYHRRHIGLRYMGVMASRGCPYKCTFCAHTCGYSVRPLVDVMGEIDSYISDYKLDMVVFYDNTLNARHGYYVDLIEALRSRHISWSASIRLDMLTDDIVKDMKLAGCKYLVVGVESFNQSRLDMMNKHMTVKDIRDGLDILHKYDIGYHGNVLVGFEGDTLDDVKKEIASIPNCYNIFPTRVRPFVGVKESCRSAMTKKELTFIDGLFKDYVESKGKYLYPTLPEIAL
jgi:radical SAM superfamily enzyme YgiQ (UPF0313 family)